MMQVELNQQSFVYARYNQVYNNLPAKKLCVISTILLVLGIAAIIVNGISLLVSKWIATE